ncbi:hypothetical protein CGLAU_03600 [Corynebacterium glaucum]|uniref:Uncharacterized protein n=1 Tax=Corynebacterium glaucum TaxID=187491 RepID=A0A1Q2HV22_9CORY|nr:hypothetical protein [Corynebacterium glaucum]AQQ14697.1 hypothetical protein CGLAU_03600 [Corynebacterium glaucum]
MLDETTPIDDRFKPAVGTRVQASRIGVEIGTIFDGTHETNPEASAVRAKLRELTGEE